MLELQNAVDWDPEVHALVFLFHLTLTKKLELQVLAFLIA